VTTSAVARRKIPYPPPDPPDGHESASTCNSPSVLRVPPRAPALCWSSWRTKRRFSPQYSNPGIIALELSFFLLEQVANELLAGIGRAHLRWARGSTASVTAPAAQRCRWKRRALVGKCCVYIFGPSSPWCLLVAPVASLCPLSSNPSASPAHPDMSGLVSFISLFSSHRCIKTPASYREREKKKAVSHPRSKGRRKWYRRAGCSHHRPKTMKNHGNAAIPSCYAMFAVRCSARCSGAGVEGTGRFPGALAIRPGNASAVDRRTGDTQPRDASSRRGCQKPGVTSFEILSYSLP